MSIRHLASALFLVSVVLGLGISAMGCSQTEERPAERSSSLGEDSLSPGHAAMRATIDPETGALTVRAGRGRLPLDPATREALRRDTEGLQEVHHPNGAVSVNLEGRFQSASVARIGEDGKLVICTQDADIAEGPLNAPVVSQAKPEVQ